MAESRYLIRWENPTAADSWSWVDDVTDDLKRVFYKTHTLRGAVRIRPLADTDELSLTVIYRLTELY